MPRTKKTREDYYRLANTRGFKCLNASVQNTKTKTTWECSHEHQWQASYNAIKMGNGCPICYNTNKRIKKPLDYQLLAEKQGFIWIGTEVRNVLTKTTWKCPHEHQWQASYSNILQGSGCPACFSSNSRNTEDDYHKLAKERGFVWLGRGVKSVNTKTKWRCDKGHLFEATYARLTTCSLCRDVRKGITDYHSLAKEKGISWIGSSAPYTHVKTDWQCNQGHTWESTYNKIQQNRLCTLCNRGIRSKMTAIDYHNLAKEKGFIWLGNKTVNVGTRTIWKCYKGHLLETSYKGLNTCPYCEGRWKSIEDYHNLAKRFNLVWEGEKLPTNIITSTKWRNSEGEVHEVSYNTARRQRGDFSRKFKQKTPTDYHELAKERGFTWLGPEAEDTLDNHTYWQCGKGHEWKTTYNNIRNGSGCLKCYKLSRLENKVEKVIKPCKPKPKKIKSDKVTKSKPRNKKKVDNKIGKGRLTSLESFRKSVLERKKLKEDLVKDLVKDLIEDEDEDEYFDY